MLLWDAGAACTWWQVELYSSGWVSSKGAHARMGEACK